MTAESAPAYPSELRVNAWTGGETAAGPLGPRARGWALSGHGRALPQLLAPEEEADPADWRDPRVGWGLVLPDDDALPDDVKARGDDAPEPLRELLAARSGSPVLRYRTETELRFTHLRRYYTDRSVQDIALSGPERGTGVGALPRYLLLYGGPDVIPWDFQYLANQSAAVGRLTLTGVGLENYVTALLGNWPGSAARPTHTVVWAADHGPADITRVMRTAIAARVQRSLAGDSEIGAHARYLDGGQHQATAAALYQALGDHHPALVVTTSHGKTGPLTDPAAMVRDLGLPVDDEYSIVDPARVLDAWQPDGAIWYAHACCSAGSDGSTIYAGLLEAGSWVDQVLTGIAGIGAHVAPLPEALLGAPRPLRAFIGHVEPTFDWTIQNPHTGQKLTTSICRGLYDGLFRPAPVGLALREPYSHVGELFAQRDSAYRAFDEGADSAGVAMATTLAARDRQSMVVLGDPTVGVPPLPSRAR
ncbi:hypothetical protein [Blastococcus montanus]|uniref:hypothetical protein n=1 Tax=Blastococcus montanus TaxID=3144973 RepID=UPI00320B31F1